ncbi:MAG: hypothetical protein KGL31_02155 [candidate division NC10 bacterium]|nr:hypothetical protein [candidate division NC10 bacterium]MDE2320708.1 hypothetical protein [candidate division NC10 bacterium]
MAGLSAMGRDLGQPAHRMSAHEDAAGVGGHDPDLALEGVDYCVVKEATELPSV